MLCEIQAEINRGQYIAEHGASAATRSALDHFIHQDKNNRHEKSNCSLRGNFTFNHIH